MQPKAASPIALLAAAMLILGAAACATGEQAPGDTASAPGTQEIPITTASAEARSLYLEGRQLSENLRFADARSYFTQAVEKDPNFALAHLALANNAPTANEFFASMRDAVSAAQGAHEAERHMILAADAQLKGDVDAQREHLTKLVESFPQDQRAHTLLGTYHFGRQEYEDAVRAFETARSIDPAYAPPYNMLGYANRYLGRFDAAEAAFKKYIDLIPAEPNPYDSYAELLMKMGRYQESIDQYRAALEKNPNFIASYVGIGNNQILMGKPDEALATFAKIGEIARNSNERRQSLLWTAVCHLHQGKKDAALEALGRRLAIAEQAQDWPAMSADHDFIGEVHLESGSPAEAMKHYAKAVELIEKASVPEEVRQAVRRDLLYNESRVALAEKDLAKASAKADEYAKAVETLRIPSELRQSEELHGRVALAKKDFEAALDHLADADQHDPRVLYLMAVAYKESGDAAKSRELCETAANFNEVDLGLCFVRAKAQKMLAQG